MVKPFIIDLDTKSKDRDNVLADPRIFHIVKTGWRVVKNLTRPHCRSITIIKVSEGRDRFRLQVGLDSRWLSSESEYVGLIGERLRISVSLILFFFFREVSRLHRLFLRKGPQSRPRWVTRTSKSTIHLNGQVPEWRIVWRKRNHQQ